MTGIDLSIQGLQEVQDANNKAMAAMRPSGAFGRGIQYATATIHRYVLSIAHVDTGAMRAAQRQEIKKNRGRIYTDPGARNPRSGVPPAEYIVYEEARGGGHAVYTRAVEEAGPRAASQAESIIKRGLP